MKLNPRYSKEELQSKFSGVWNSLYQSGLKYNSPKLYDPECAHYVYHYNQLLNLISTKSPNILEIGVKEGDSLRMWRDVLPEESKIYGIEINQDPLTHFSLPNTTIFYGDQTDHLFLHNVASNVENIDIIVDDGGHTQEQIKTSFDYLFKYCLSMGGYYVVEDLGCSYWNGWSGDSRYTETAIDYFLKKVHSVNFRFWKGGRSAYVPKPDISEIDVEYFDRYIESITFAKGMCLIKKGDNYLHGA